jgi:uncharacterized protein YegJ (DUF2314 family)
MNLFASAPFRVLLLLTFFVSLIGGFAWYAATLKYKKDTAHLQFVDPNNELWTKAKTKATATLDTFTALYPQNPANSFIKFTHDGPSGFKEDIWAKVTSIGPGYVGIVVEAKYLKENENEANRELPMGQVIDWMIELPDGLIRGGFTTQALLLIEMQKEASATDEELSNFVDKIND